MSWVLSGKLSHFPWLILFLYLSVYFTRLSLLSKRKNSQEIKAIFLDFLGGREGA
jgi:hypothetical protein